MAKAVAAKSVSSSMPFRRTNLFVVGVVLLYFGNRWFWDTYNAQSGMTPLALWTFLVASFIIATFGLFSLGRSFFDE